MNLQPVKSRFGIVGNSPGLERALATAVRVAPADITVLVRGESGTGKEALPKIIHHNSARKHGAYIAVNCGAIPEGTIDSELFGHEKGSFTGAHEARKGYFEEADGGTIFLDEVGELPMATQARLLRVLETGEYLRVGSSKVRKTDVRVVAATNLDFDKAMVGGKFREDLFYRLNQVPLMLPPLRERGEDIHLLFRKFTADFSDRHHMPPIRLGPEAVELLQRYPWPGNVRQLKNIAEQISAIETERKVDADRLLDYLPELPRRDLATVGEGEGDAGPGMNEREILYKLLFEMKSDLTDLKSLVLKMIRTGDMQAVSHEDHDLVNRVFGGQEGANVLRLPERAGVPTTAPSSDGGWVTSPAHDRPHGGFQEADEVEETLSLVDSERELIRRALAKHGNRRKQAAAELGISERTLYRKIKEFGLK
ncbi:MAG: sigma-54-dependent Fis family transcriptional regulator [Crocinitomicaceae bacterium TMED114]|nr:MAG: sigma-54-dependent Fis family transcriptional regulator [Crocinitomicaceae bacterium TMED114]